MTVLKSKNSKFSILLTVLYCRIIAFERADTISALFLTCISAEGTLNRI